MEMYTISQWIMFFYIYCFIGWVWESCYVSVKQRKLVNRGFLKGPFLPIYGSGALCVLIVTIPVRGNIPLMFLIGMAAATLLEYVTGAVMERIFRVRYWDYTDKFMNVNGYICLGSSLCWGVMTVLIVDVVHKYIEELVFLVDEKYITILVLLMTPAITADFVTSFHAAIHLRDILVQNERIKEELQKLGEKRTELEQALREAGEKAAFVGGQAVLAGGKVKEQAVLAGGKVKEQAVLAGEKVKEQAVLAGEKVKEQAALAAEKAKEQSEEKEREREQAALAGGKSREQISQELQELLLKIGELKGRLTITNGKSIRGLLKRNPQAVSRWHRESFSEMKNNLMDKFGEFRK